MSSWRQRAAASPSASASAPDTAGVDGDETVVPFRKREKPASIPFWQMAAAAAILAMVFTGGLMTRGIFETPQQTAEQKPGWREAAARYVALFSKATLEGMPSDPAERQANIDKIAGALGLQLSSEKIGASGLDFHGTQLLQFDGKPLAQISYLHDGRTPVALCIIRTANPAAAPAREMRHGQNIVHWVAGGYGFMVIGDLPDPEIERIAQEFHAHFS
ncbi:MAG: hypothetical protein HC850_10890 [Rhodomicrobium sp.]|nr:hypothetical protein [Rhodomicrobium sp.]